MEHSFFVRARPFFMMMLAFVFLLVASFGIWVKATGALLGLGGMIESTLYCTCSLNSVIVLGPPTPGVYAYQPFLFPPSVTYEYGPPYRPGQWVLGSYVPGGVCLMAGTPCFPSPLFPIGTITQVGTSL